MFIGCDYSYTSPSICLSKGKEFINNTWYYLHDSKKRIHNTHCFKGTKFPNFSSNFKKFDYISDWALEIISGYNVDSIHLEGYSMGSTGQVFDIAENTMLLKYKLVKSGKKIKLVSPGTLKKFATTKGNANKEKMQEAFKENTGVNIKELLNQPEKQWNPSSDIIDSYFLARYAAMQKEDSTYYEIIG